MTRDGILNGTAELYFHFLREDTDFTALVALLASSVEFASLLAGKKRGSKKERKDRQAKIEELEKEIDAKKEELGVEENPIMRKESKVGVTSAVARRVRALLWSHLLRMDLPEKELRDGQ